MYRNIINKSNEVAYERFLDKQQKCDFQQPQLKNNCNFFFKFIFKVDDRNLLKGSLEIRTLCQTTKTF